MPALTGAWRKSKVNWVTKVSLENLCRRNQWVPWHTQSWNGSQLLARPGEQLKLWEYGDDNTCVGHQHSGNIISQTMLVADVWTGPCAVLLPQSVSGCWNWADAYGRLWKSFQSYESQNSPESVRYFRADDIFKRNPHGFGIPVPSWFLNAVGFNICLILIWASCILSLNQAFSRW